jgi:hypothetical protein
VPLFVDMHHKVDWLTKEAGEGAHWPTKPSGVLDDDAWPLGLCARSTTR